MSKIKPSQSPDLRTLNAVGGSCKDVDEHERAVALHGLKVWRASTGQEALVEAKRKN